VPLDALGWMVLRLGPSIPLRFRVGGDGSTQRSWLPGGPRATELAADLPERSLFDRRVYPRGTHVLSTSTFESASTPSYAHRTAETRQEFLAVLWHPRARQPSLSRYPILDSP
jgi:hypothetical protein